MGVETVKTANGVKLRDSKSKKLAGSVATKGKKAPTAKIASESKKAKESKESKEVKDLATIPAKKVKKYGSLTHEINAVLDQITHLTPEQEKGLTEAYQIFNIDPGTRHLFSKKHSEAIDARGKAIKKLKKAGIVDPLPGYIAVINEAKARAWGETSSRFRDDVWSNSKSVQRDTLVALLSYDLVGSKVFTREHFDSMLEPWESVFGKFKIKK